MWRGAAGLIIVGSLAVTLFYHLTIALCRAIDGLHETPDLSKRVTQPWAIILLRRRFMLLAMLQAIRFYLWNNIVWFCLGLIAMAVGRMYFLVEAFVSLRAPAPRIYETVQWTQFWPHM